MTKTLIVKIENTSLKPPIKTTTEYMILGPNIDVDNGNATATGKGLRDAPHAPDYVVSQTMMALSLQHID